jgi:hypothetical protein
VRPWGAVHPDGFDAIALLNVLDRCDTPFTLLAQLRVRPLPHCALIARRYACISSSSSSAAYLSAPLPRARCQMSAHLLLMHQYACTSSSPSAAASTSTPLLQARCLTVSP